jgi:hypothetical protein
MYNNTFTVSFCSECVLKDETYMIFLVVCFLMFWIISVSFICRNFFFENDIGDVYTNTTCKQEYIYEGIIISVPTTTN